jgi:hypothetical protein
MDKRNATLDFGADLASLTGGVESEVGDLLEVLQNKKRARIKPASTTGGNHMTTDTQTLEAGPQAAASEPAPQPSLEAPRKRSASRNREPIYRDEPVLKNVTTRLRRETNELLSESALRQQLKKETPATRQDILEEALQDWFKRHGYKYQPAPGADD